MKTNKTLITISLAILLLLLATSNVNALFISKEIIPSNNIKESNQKHHPVINLKNTTNRNIKVDYDYYIVKVENKYIQDVGSIVVPAKTTVNLELPKLEFLGGTNNVRTIWFSWESDSKLKPNQNQIDTEYFNALDKTEPEPNKPEVELGCK